MPVCQVTTYRIGKARGDNGDVPVSMCVCYKSMLPPPKKGRLPKEQEESMQKYQTLTRKLEDHENS